MVAIDVNHGHLDAAVVAPDGNILGTAAEARAEGRERTGSRPSRGRRGRAFRRVVAGIPTARLRDRLTQMAANAGRTQETRHPTRPPAAARRQDRQASPDHVLLAHQER